MNKQRTRRQRAGRAAARTLAVGVAVAALAATLGAGQALAATDERVLERQGRIDRQNAASQADEQGKAAEPSQHKATQVPRRFFRPEPPMDTSPGSTLTSSSRPPRHRRSGPTAGPTAGPVWPSPWPSSPCS